jgi:hypothetical protein
MANKISPVTALAVALLTLAVVGAEFVNLAQGDPYIGDFKMEGTTPVPEGTKPPTITISSPANHSAYSSNNFLLNFSTAIEESNNISLSIREVYYIASWQKDKTEIDLISLFVKNNYTWPSSFSINITDIPKGPHWIDIYAVATGFAYETRQEIEGIYDTTYYVGYEITGLSTVDFTIGSVPSILSVSLENKTYTSASVSLNVITNESLSQASYCLDGQENVTFNGNTTLTGLTNGDHSLIIYSTDMAGIESAPKTVYFNVELSEPFPTVTVATVSAVAAVVVAAGLLVYHKKH